MPLTSKKASLDVMESLHAHWVQEVSYWLRLQHREESFSLTTE